MNEKINERSCYHCGGTGKWRRGELNAIPPDCYFCNGTGIIQMKIKDMPGSDDEDF